MADTKVDGKAKLKQTESALATTRKTVTQQAAKLAKARAQVKTMRSKAAESGTKAAQAALVKAREIVRKEAAELDQVRSRLRGLTAEQKAMKLLVAQERIEARAQERLEKARKAVENRRQRDFSTALGKFEKRWQKRRAAADQRKLKNSAAKAERRIKAATKKVQTALKGLEKKGLLSAALASAVKLVRPTASRVAKKAAAKPVTKKAAAKPVAKKAAVKPVAKKAAAKSAPKATAKPAVRKANPAARKPKAAPPSAAPAVSATAD